MRQVLALQVDRKRTIEFVKKGRGSAVIAIHVGDGELGGEVGQAPLAPSFADRPRDNMDIAR